MTTLNGTATGSKELPEEAIRRSAIQPQTQVLQQPGFIEGGAESGLFFLARKSDGIVPWGFAPTYRDRQLRAFLPLEPFTMSAIATICATNMGLSWVLDGPPATVERVQDVLHSANFGDGWEAWSSTMSLDFYTQDKAAVSELVRDEDRPDAPVIGLNHLDALRCWHTGNPITPVLYMDRLGKWHALKWYQVIKLAELPAPHELLYGLQYSALTRVLGISQIIRNILLLQDEKSGGRHTRSVKIISGIKKGEIENAMKLAQTAADQAGMLRWLEPVLVPTTDPNAKPEMIELDLVSMPDGFTEHMDDYFKWFMVALSMGLLRDYQDFAPLPGGGLGTSAQSQILHMKTRGKGPAIWQKRVEHSFNFNGVVPRNVNFHYDESDIEEEQQRAEMFTKYAEGYQKMIDALVLDPEGVRALMLDNKLIPQELFDELNKRDILPATAAVLPGQPNSRQGAGNGQSQGTDDSSMGVNADGQAQDDTALGQRGMTIDVTADRLVVEDELTSTAERALGVMGRDVSRRLRRKTISLAGIEVPAAKAGGAN